MKKKYFENNKGIFFSQGFYNTSIDKNNNLLYDFMVEDGFKIDNLRQLGFPSMGQNNYPAYYSIKYNCIGWAFGIDEDIEPVLPTEDYVTYKTLEDFLNLTHDVYPLSTQLEKYVNKSSVIYSYSYQSNKIHTQHTMGDYFPKICDVAFYFGKTEETSMFTEERVLLHTARYFNVSFNNDRWTSKVGENLCVSHDLVDLIGGTYGEPEFILGDIL